MCSMSPSVTASSAKTLLSVGNYGAACSEVTIVFTLMHGEVNNPLLGEQYPDSKVHGANMGPIWGRQDLGGPHVGPMNFAIWVECVPKQAKWLGSKWLVKSPNNEKQKTPQVNWVQRQGQVKCQVTSRKIWDRKKAQLYQHQSISSHSALHAPMSFPLFWLTYWGTDTNDCHFADCIFKCIFFNENISLLIKISLKYVLMVQIRIYQDWFW